MATDQNLLYYGDNLDILRRYIKDESVDLIYLDPPFNSNATYNVLFEAKDGKSAPAQIKAFEDTWQWDRGAAEQYYEIVQSGGPVADALVAFSSLLGHNDMLAYLTMMAPRLMEMTRALKPNGSMYLHCDPVASHYLKILMDAVFGKGMFGGEIIWKRTSSHGRARGYGAVHDVILFYSKSQKQMVWNHQYQPYDEEYIDDFFEMQDKDGQRWKRGDLTGAGVRTGDSGRVWRGIDVTAKGRHWALPSYLNERYRKITGDDLESYAVVERLDKIDGAGLIHWPKKKGGVPRYKCYLEDMPGVPLQDIWTDIGPIHNLAKERLGYPTQKPLALLDRIIRVSSNEGDVVMDPFCGCGTAIEAAHRLNRKWIGIDITHLAVGLMRRRLMDAFGDDVGLDVVGEPKSVEGAAELAKSDPYQFQWWALGLVGARPTNPADQKKGADHGIDGRLYFHDEGDRGKTKQVILSVKAGKNVSVSMIRDLRGVIEREKAQIGVLISMKEPTKPMRKEAVEAGFYDSPWGTRHPRLQIMTIEDLIGGKGIDYPGRGQHNVTHKRAPRVQAEVDQGLLDV